MGGNLELDAMLFLVPEAGVLYPHGSKICCYVIAISLLGGVRVEVGIDCHDLCS